jgi:hypothetical protein
MELGTPLDPIIIRMAGRAITHGAGDDFKRLVELHLNLLAASRLWGRPC